MKSIDVRILVKNSHFINDIIPFIRKNSSKSSLREYAINSILDIEEGDIYTDRIFDLSGTSLGCINDMQVYEGTYRNATNLTFVSHVIDSILITDHLNMIGKVRILSTPFGGFIKHYQELSTLVEKYKYEVWLMPIYNDENKILTFDITYNPEP